MSPDRSSQDAHGGYSPEEARSLENARQFVEVYCSAFPDMHIIVEDQIAEGDKVVTVGRLVAPTRASLSTCPQAATR